MRFFLHLPQHEDRQVLVISFMVVSVYIIKPDLIHVIDFLSLTVSCSIKLEHIHKFIIMLCNFIELIFYAC